ncbi:methyl-accepting chemotaxis protein [Roseobacter sp. EG26]|uniref:methyl-accepting chemotaxis protein n=1 Tax=Roseobacter sp. EG26 TaxID=3412477 RepID=UPI003CE52A1B
MIVIGSALIRRPDMELNLDWTKDPVVQLEDEILPVLWIPIDFVLEESGNADIQDVSGRMDRAADLLRSSGSEYFQAEGAMVEAAHREICQVAANSVDQTHELLRDFASDQTDPDRRAAVLKSIRETMRPAVLEAINVLRETFLTMVLSRQYKHANMSKHSIAELDVISKKIFYVAINASVEAARLGDQGAGFAHISTEIRSLSQSARAAIDNMKSGR